MNSGRLSASSGLRTQRSTSWRSTGLGGRAICRRVAALERPPDDLQPILGGRLDAEVAQRHVNRVLRQPSCSHGLLRLFGHRPIIRADDRGTRLRRGRRRTEDPRAGRITRSRGAGPRRYLRSVPNFAVTLVHACNWDTKRSIREQERWAEHAAFMDGLVDDGFIVVGGPLGSGERTLHLVDAPDEQAVRSRLRSDPWAQMGLLEVGSITEWALWLDGRNAAR